LIPRPDINLVSCFLSAFDRVEGYNLLGLLRCRIAPSGKYTTKWL
jgi:hypothetical protein